MPYRLIKFVPDTVMSKGKITVNIYKIDQNSFGNRVSNEGIIDRIIEKYNNQNPRKRFNKTPIRPGIDFCGFDVRLFFSSKDRTPNWKNFVSPILADSSDLQKDCRDIAYIAFIYDDKNLFAISGGYGNHVIQDYSEPNFGTEIITRLISKQSDVIKSLKERGITGSILGSTIIFRRDSKLAYQDSFGKVYKELQAELSKSILTTQFGFSDEEISKAVKCNAKRTFKLGKSINFTRLLKILKQISEVLEHEKNFTLNYCSKLNSRNKRDKLVIEGLEYLLYSKLYNYCKEKDTINFEFCAPDFEKYAKADTYNIYKGQSRVELLSEENLSNIQDILSKLCEINIFDLTDYDDFRNTISELNVKSCTNEGINLTKGPFIKHVHGEIKQNNKSYFYIDGEWYRIQYEFLNELNNFFKNGTEEVIYNKILKAPFDVSKQQTEDDYIKKYLDKGNFLVLHKIKPENIELCDLLHYDNNNTNLVHIKKGFDNSMRDLVLQILISAKRVQADIATSQFTFLKKVYESLKNGIESDSRYLRTISKQEIKENEFIELFKKKNIIFSLAFVDTATRDKNIKKDIEEFGSNIAKFSIKELSKELRNIDFRFRIIQIKKV